MGELTHAERGYDFRSVSRRFIYCVCFAMWRCMCIKYACGEARYVARALLMGNACSAPAESADTASVPCPKMGALYAHVGCNHSAFDAWNG